MRKILFVIFVALSISVNAYDFVKDGVYYNILSSNQVEVTYKSHAVGSYEGDIVIPQMVDYNGKTYVVVKIGDWAFAESKLLTSIILPESISTIGEYSFNCCEYLKSLNLPTGVTSIKSAAFQGCYRLAIDTLIVPQTMTRLESSTFNQCNKIKNIILPEGLASIGDNAFHQCYSLKKIKIPSSVTTIEGHAFQECSEIDSIVIPKAVTKIEEYTFSGCNNLKYIDLPDDIFYIGDWNFYSCQIDTFKIPTKLKILGNMAFPSVSEAYYYKTNDPVFFEDLNLNKNATLFVPKGCVDIFRSNECWSIFNYIVETGPIYIAVVDTVKVYGEDNPQFRYVSDGVDLVGVPTINCVADKESNVGEYLVILEKGTIKNDTIFFTNGTLQVNKALLNVTVDATEREYGDDNPEFKVSYQGFKNSDTQNVLTEFPCAETIATKNSDVGEYDIIVSGGEAQNYEITCHNGMLTIVKAMLSVKADNVEREYGEDNPEFKCSYQGFKNSDTQIVLTNIPNAETIATKDSDVGEYDIIVSGGEAKNYILNYQNGIMNIIKAKLKASIGEYSMEQGGDFPEIKIVYEGFKNNDNENVIDVLPVFSIDIPDNYEPGIYDILLKGGEDNNYCFEYKNGILSITEPSGIVNMMKDNHPFNVYTMYGLIVRHNVQSIDGLSPGCYIIEKNGKFYKIGIK